MKRILYILLLILLTKISLAGNLGTAIDPLSYADEPQEKSEITETGVRLVYKPCTSNLMDIIIYNESGSAIWIDLYTDKVFPVGTFPINFTYEENTVLASAGIHQPSCYQTISSYWYLTSGYVNISRNEDKWIFDVDAYTYNGTHISVHYEGYAEWLGSINPKIDFSYDAEPDTRSRLNYTFSKCQYKWYNGILALDMGNDTTQLYIELVTAEIEPPAGVYPVATDSVPGTLIASPGGTDNADYGTFLALFDKQENWLCTYYIVSGTLSVKRENEQLTMLFTGKSKKGSEVTVTYIDKTDTSVEKVTDAMSSGKRYNLLGQEVGADYRGIVITNGKKQLIME